MQQLLGFTPTVFFAFGPSEKSSLIAEYCRENNCLHLKNPIPETLSHLEPLDTIIEGSCQLFDVAQKGKQNLEVIFFGDPQGERQANIKREYCSIGLCRRVKNLNYPQFRRAMYPNLIFFYGPNKDQISQAALTMAQNISYVPIILPQNANIFISGLKKTCNYVIEGLFTSKQEIKILEQYFNIRVVHFQYNRVELSNEMEFFDREFEIFPFLKSKPYYIRVNGSAHPLQVMDAVNVGLCPQLVYVNRVTAEHDEYIKEYIKDSDGLLIGIREIQSIRKRKNLPLADSNQGKMQLLTEILFKDLNRKQAVLVDYPWNVPNEIVRFEEINRKFSLFIDLVDPEDYEFDQNFQAPIYFLDEQKRVTPNQQRKLKQELTSKIDYWIVSGPTCSGKSTVAKFIASQYGYKLIEFEGYLAAIKEKLIGPEDGDELPLKKILAHFASLLKDDQSTIYLFDGLPYEGKDLRAWIDSVGAPNVVNLKVQAQGLIKRTRKKNQADLNAEVSEQENTKVNESLAKNEKWINALSELSPSSKLFQVDYNMPQIMAEEIISSLLRPRVYLVQNHQSLVFQNIAIKYEMTFVNLERHQLRDCLPLIKKSNKRDVILCYYQQKHQGDLISEDMYWIEKNIGPIRYLGIWEDEPTIVEEEKLELQRPVKLENKPKEGAEGEEGGEKAPEEPPKEGQEGGDAKKKLNIYDYEWTNPRTRKNLSQWFLKLKKNVTERKKGPLQCYRSFQQVLDVINANSKNCVYQRIV